MATPPLLDFAALTAPISGDNPAGGPVPFAVREKLEEARKEIDPDSFDADDPMRPAEPKRADWPAIERLAVETLGETSKDLLVAARLTEALSKQHGFAGFRDGLHLLRLLVEDCWDRIYPAIEEEGDLELRAGPFNWLDEADRGARFPYTLRTLPLLSGGDGQYGWLEWRQSQDGRGSVTRDAFEKALQATPRERLQVTVEDIAEGLAELNGLGQTLNAKIGAAAPGLTGLRQALADCGLLAEQMLQRKGPAPVAVEAEADGEGAASGAETSATGKRPTSRAQVYQQLTAASDTLRDLEPHSPIPYLIQRAVELGALPFPQLMKALIRDASVLEEMNRELGIKEASEEG